MICILKHNASGDLIGWLIAKNWRHATEKADQGWQPELYEWMSAHEFEHKSVETKYTIPISLPNGDTYKALID